MNNQSDWRPAGIIPDFDQLAAKANKLPHRTLHQARDKALTLVMLSTAVRVGEAAALNWDDWDRATDTATVVTLKQKGRPRRRIVPLTLPGTVDALLSYEAKLTTKKGTLPTAMFPTIRSKSARRLRTRAMYDIIQQTLGIHPHVTRHSRTYHLVESGMRLDEVQQITGHANLGNLSGYLHASTASVLAKVVKADRRR